MTVTAARADSSTDRVLREIEERVLWLATAIVDHANRVRPNPAGLEVGGHQASSVDGDDHDLPVVGAAAGRGPGPATWILDAAFPAERAAPMVTVLDGHPHTPAFLAGVRGVPAAHLGVTRFGQSGDLDSVYRHHGLDTGTVIGAALDLVD